MRRNHDDDNSRKAARLPTTSAMYTSSPDGIVPQLPVLQPLGIHHGILRTPVFLEGRPLHVPLGSTMSLFL